MSFDITRQMCHLMSEELTDDQLIDNYYCRNCGYTIDEHMQSSASNQDYTYTIEQPDDSCPAPWSRYAASADANDQDDSTGLSRQEAAKAIDRIWTRLQEEQLAEREAELKNTRLTIGDKTIHWHECNYSRIRPPTGYSLWISMHGGGGCPAPQNEQQFQNQISLYNPDEGIWVIPRSPTDSWNQWHQEHIDPMFDRIIENYIMAREINPNRVYILGYSAGGDGVYQLAPRMADRFAAAAMMAGHPNDASPLSLRNLPFAIFVGENDGAYNRNEVAAQWEKQLDQLQRSDPEGYRHHVNICANMGHWMCGRDAEALSWMARWTRNPWPKKVVWVQDDVLHRRFYWLSLPESVEVKQGQKITAEIKGQTINISTSDDIRQLTLRLYDALLDLDQPVTVNVENHGQVFQDRVLRTAKAIKESLLDRADPSCAATAYLKLHW